MTALRVADYFTAHPFLFKPNGEHEVGGTVHMSTDVTSPFSYVSLELIKKFGAKVSLAGPKMIKSFRHQTDSYPTDRNLDKVKKGFLSFNTFLALVLRNKKPGRTLFWTNIIILEDEANQILPEKICLAYSKDTMMWMLYLCTDEIFKECAINNQYKVFLLRV